MGWVAGWVARKVGAWFGFLQGAPGVQWVVAVLLFPLAYGFDGLLRWVGGAGADGVFGSAAVGVGFLILTGLLCFWLMRHKHGGRLWILLGFFFGGYAVFYALVMRLASRFYPNGRGVLFWNFDEEQMRSAYWRMVFWAVFLFGVVFFVAWGVDYVYSVGLV